MPAAKSRKVSSFSLVWQLAIFFPHGPIDMKKNSKLVKRIERCLSAIFCISALFACFTSTYAWFTASRAVQASAVEFTANEGPLPFSKIEIFKQDTSVATPSNPYRFSTTASGTYTVSQKNGQNTIDYVAADTSDSTKDDLAKYDNLLVGYTQCILYLFTLRDSVSQSELDDISIQTKRNDSSLCLFLANSDNATPTNQLQATGNALSNIISFQTLGLETALTASDVSTASSTTVSVYQLDTSTVKDKKSDLFVDKDQLNSNGFLPDVSYYSSSKSLFDPATGTYSTTDSTKALKQVAVINCVVKPTGLPVG